MNYGTVYAVKLSEYKDVVSTLMCEEIKSVMCCLHCCHVFLFRNIYMICNLGLEYLASGFWPLSTSLAPPAFVGCGSREHAGSGLL